MSRSIHKTIKGVFGGKSKKAGEGAFDVDKPQSVQNSMDKADQSRLSRFQASNNNNK